MKKLIPWIAIPTALALGAALFTYEKAFYHAPKKRSREYEIPDAPLCEDYKQTMDRLVGTLREIPCEEVSIRSFDGTVLRGFYYHVADGAPMQIQFHGYKGTPMRDFCGGNALAREMGQNTLLVEQRAHGTSRRRSICFGIKERRDCLAWVEYAVKRFGAKQKILLSGVSMGAATVLMASELNLPDNVVGIIADCPYSSPREIICKVASDVGYPAKVAYPFLWLGALVYGHFRLDASSAVNAVRNARVPILLIHGEEDDFVPCEMSRKIKAAGGALVRLETFPKASHGMSYMVDPERYRRISREFCEACLKTE